MINNNEKQRMKMTMKIFILPVPTNVYGLYDKHIMFDTIDMVSSAKRIPLSSV